MHPLDEDDEEENEQTRGGRTNDPYGSLGQFGTGEEAEMGYAADAPAPRRMGGKEEDLLF